MALEPQKVYEEWQVQRDSFLDDAEEAATLTCPELRPKGEKIDTRPFTQLGTQAARSLASTMHRITMPPQVKWLKLDVADEVRRSLDGRVEPRTRIPLLEVLDQMLSTMENRLIKDLFEMQGRSRFASAILRNLIEGTTAVAVVNNQVRIYPLRNFVNYRDGGRVRVLVTREEFVDNVFEEPPAQSEQEREWLYTLVDFDDNKVTQQRENEKPQRVRNVDASQWFVFVGHVPSVEQYASSYVFQHLGVINEINHLSRSLAEAAATAAWHVPVIREGSNITPDLLKDRKSGQPLVGNPEDLSWFSSSVKIADWAFVAQYRQTLRDELAAIFALGIKDRVGKAATATEILQITNELETHTQDLLTAYEETLQRPVVEALMVLRGFDQLRLPGGEKAIEVIITTGQNALQREASLSRMVQMTAIVQPLDPTMRVDGVSIMEEAGRAMQFETKGFFSRAQPAPQQENGALPADAAGANQGLATANGQPVAGGPQPGPPVPPDRVV